MHIVFVSWFAFCFGLLVRSEPLRIFRLHASLTMRGWHLPVRDPGIWRQLVDPLSCSHSSPAAGAGAVTVFETSPNVTGFD